MTNTAGRFSIMLFRRLIIPAVLAWCASGWLPAKAAEGPAKKLPAWVVDHRYAPLTWQTAICFPDDAQKTLVGKEGTLLYDYSGRDPEFSTRISVGV